MVIGGIATVAICSQNELAPLAVGWGLLHGAGPAALLALVPLAGSLAMLWGGAVFLNRRAARGRPILFGLLAAAILFLNEALLPTTPLKAWRAQRAGAQPFEGPSAVCRTPPSSSDRTCGGNPPGQAGLLLTLPGGRLRDIVSVPESTFNARRCPGPRVPRA